MESRKLEASAGLGWLKDGVNLGRNNPKAIFGGAALILVSIMALAMVFGVAAGISGAARVGGAGMMAMVVVLMVAMMLLVTTLMVGYLRLIDNVEHGRPAGASEVFNGFRDVGTSLRALGFVIILAVVQNLLLVLVITLLAPDVGNWYLQLLQTSTHGAAQPQPPALPAGFALAASMMWALGLFSYAVQALGLGQIALRGRGVFAALADGVVGAARNLLPLLVMLLVLMAASFVAVIAVVLVVLLVTLLVKFVGAWLGVVIAIPLYIALLLMIYVVMFGVMYAMWHGILGDVDAPAQQPGLEA